MAYSKEVLETRYKAAAAKHAECLLAAEVARRAADTAERALDKSRREVETARAELVLAIEEGR